MATDEDLEEIRRGIELLTHRLELHDQKVAFISQRLTDVLEKMEKSSDTLNEHVQKMGEGIDSLAQHAQAIKENTNGGGFKFTLNNIKWILLAVGVGATLLGASGEGVKKIFQLVGLGP